MVASEYISESDQLSLIVVLNKQGGTGGTDTIKVKKGYPIPKIVPPTRTGYEFKGYYEEPNGGGKQYFDGNGEPVVQSWDKSGNGVLYALWTLSLTKMQWKTDFKWNDDRLIEDFKTDKGYHGYVNMHQPAGKKTSISKIELDSDNNGDIIKMIGNDNKKGKGATWTKLSNQYKLTHIDFDYNINYGDSFGAAGLMFNITEESGKLTGYLLSFNASNIYNGVQRGRLYGMTGYYGAIFKFEYKLGACENVIEKVELVKGFDTGTNNSGKISIEPGTNGYKITVAPTTGTEQVISINVDSKDLKQNNYGFFSEHFAHGCDSVGYFELKNFKIQAIKIES